jgi:hypothetical protein
MPIIQFTQDDLANIMVGKKRLIFNRAYRDEKNIFI